MEWLLQVADEIDDAVWAVRHRCIGVIACFDVPVAAMLAAVAASAARQPTRLPQRGTER
jgi:hypothetical protein